ncbi:TSUP family transporter [Mesorhizobium sp. UC74_2]|uniref:TSUP family transporter n=1 Tax=Mesorhizobium sp. UC74_2 TaxID=3350171 RepID=UPI0036723584
MRQPGCHGFRASRCLCRLCCRRRLRPDADGLCLRPGHDGRRRACRPAAAAGCRCHGWHADPGQCHPDAGPGWLARGGASGAAADPVASLPSLFVGYALLEWLADTRADLLKIGLGLVIMLSSLQLAVRPAGLEKRSSDASFVGFGVISGLMSGLFATGGPPLVYHLFRQPLSHARIRETLVTAFGVAQAVRLVVVVASGNMPSMSPVALVLAIPTVMLMTYAARRWPPSLSQQAMRRIVFVLLFLSGLSLALPAALHLVA